MKILLRSMMIGNPSKEEPDLVFRNYLNFKESSMGFTTPEDIALWDFIQVFSQSHHHCPEVITIRTHFKHLKEIEILDRLEVLLIDNPVYRGDFLRRLENRANDRRTMQVMDLLKQAAQITQTGIEIKEGKNKKHLRGPIDAIRFLSNRSHDIVAPTTGTKLSGEVTRDGEEMKRRYEKTEADPTSGMGQFTGYKAMDDALKGARKFELWLHAAFTGHLKSTFMLNWMYNQAIYHKYDCAFFSLEMPYDQVRNILFAMHSMHGSLREPRLKYGIQTNPNITTGLQYRKIRDGELSGNEKKFFFDYVIPHFGESSHGKIHIRVADPDKDDFTIADLRSQAEILHAEDPYTMLGLDHGGLMAPRRRMGTTTENLNQVMRDLKRFSMSFNRGAGMATVVLFQIGREGFKKAEKAGSKDTHATRYNLTDLSYANEAEKSSDVVTAGWCGDDVRSKNQILFQCLKSRDNALFDPFLCRIEWSCRRILQTDEIPISEDQKRAIGDNIDSLEGIDLG